MDSLITLRCEEARAKPTTINVEKLKDVRKLMEQRAWKDLLRVDYYYWPS